MIKVIFDFLQFLLTCVPLLTSLAIFTLLSIWLAKSIRKNSKIYYAILAIPFFLVAIPTVFRWCGIPLSVNFVGIPVLGVILRDYIHMGVLGHPLLIIIMYMGALDPKISFVKKLMSIRKELSIIVGFPVLTHSLVRVANNFATPLQFFTDREAYLVDNPVTSELGAGISNFSLVFGIVMLVIFLPLWVTSFDSVRKRMGAGQWKKLQKWSYVLYATLFIHASGIAIGGMMNPRGGGAPPRNTAEVTVQQIISENSQSEQATRSADGGNHNERRGGERGGKPQSEQVINDNQQVGEQTVRPTENRSQNTQQVAAPQGRVMPKSFGDFQVPRSAVQYLHLVSLVLIYGSYLYLRIRKAKKRKTV